MMHLAGFKIGSNFAGVLIGIGLILFCLTVAQLFQKHLFSKYRGQVANTMGKSDPEQSSERK